MWIFKRVWDPVLSSTNDKKKGKKEVDNKKVFGAILTDLLNHSIALDTILWLQNYMLLDCLFQR